MPTTILKAPVGAGKTEAALQQLIQVVCDDQRPFAAAWVLLATRRQEVSFRQRLIDQQQDRQMYFNVNFFTFSSLNTLLLNRLGALPRRIDETGRLGIIRRLLTELRQKGRLNTYRTIATTPGFVRVIADFIYELKQNLIYPDELLNAAHTQKDQELALIYQQYQETMQDYDLVDREGEAWLALEAVQQNPTLVSDVTLLLVDGYDQFTPVQTQLLANLSNQVEQVVITLTTLPQQSESMGLRFERALSSLRDTHANIEAGFEEQFLPDIQLERRPDLQWLGQTIFQAVPEPQPSNGDLVLLEAAEPSEEVAVLLRRMKRLLIEGYQPDEILVAVRNWQVYEPYFESIGKLYDLPLLLQRSGSLMQNPLIVVLMNLLSLSLEDYPRRMLLDTMRSSYLRIPGIKKPHVNLLERISLDYQIVQGGIDVWQEAIEVASTEFVRDDGEVREALLSSELADDLLDSLTDFFSSIHIAADEMKTIEQHVHWVEGLIGADPKREPDDDEIESLTEPSRSLSMIACIRDLGDIPEGIITRDVSALSAFKDILRGLVMTQDLLLSLFGEKTKISWRNFYDALQLSVRQVSALPHNLERSGRILVTTATDARGLPHRCLVIPGLAEGMFPAEVREDPLYLDNERIQLNHRGVMLPTQAERADDDGLFYELISLPFEQLILSRPTVKDGKLWVESHLWRNVLQSFENLPIEYYRAGDALPIEQAVTPSEVAIGLADAMNQAEVPDMIWQRQQWLANHSQLNGYWTHIVQAHATELGRMSRKAHDRYSGVIKQAELREGIARRLGGHRVWSASQFNELGICRFRFFAKRFLKLEALEEPEEGLNALQLGSLYHKILEETYSEIAAEGLPITETNLEDALEILHEKADEILPYAPRNFGFRASPFWDLEQVVLRKRLESLIEQDFLGEKRLDQYGKRQAWRQEAPFGFNTEPELNLQLTHDRVKVRGFIDRVDLIDENRLLILDYKSGSSTIPLDEMKTGRNFQMLIYLEAAEMLFPEHEIVGGLFWHIRNRSFSGMPPKPEDYPKVVEAREQGKKLLSEHIQQAQKGDFAVQPSKPDGQKCTRYCEFYQMCRLAATNPFKDVH